MKSFQFLIFFITLASFAHSFNICSRSPKWTLSNKKFPNSFANSHIKVLAFLKASCGFCQTQLARLVELQNEFNLEKKTSVSIIVINSFDQESFQLRQVFQDINKNKTLTLVQDTNLFNIWDLYTVITDDMLVFDRFISLFYSSEL